MGFLRNRVRAFKHAIDGLLSAFSGETHLKIHLNAAVIVMILGFFYKISVNEWFAVLTCIALVICLELINSAIEILCNLIHPEHSSRVKYIKDVAASAVLLAAIFSVVVGAYIFFPKIF